MIVVVVVAVVVAVPAFELVAVVEVAAVDTVAKISASHSAYPVKHMSLLHTKYLHHCSVSHLQTTVAVAAVAFEPPWKGSCCTDCMRSSDNTLADLWHWEANH